MADVDSALEQHIFDLPQRQRVPNATLICALTEPLPMLTVAALIGESLGAIQCALSRQVSVET